MEFLTTAELAALADIAESNARKAIRTCLAGKKWRGAELVVSKPDGKAHAVFAPSLPQVLYEKWLEAQPKPPVPVQEARQLPALPEKPGIRLPEPEWIEEAKWKRALIEPALAHPPRSRARGNEIKAIARREGIKARTLSDWIKRFEADGLQGLVRQRRHDAPRVFITREWDAACQLPDETKAAIAEKFTTHVKSLWRTANPGCNNTARLATTELQRLCHEAGWDGATLEHCRITRAAVEKYRHYSLVHTFGKDAKAFFDHNRPRIQRDYSSLRPMELVVGDVHPLDVVVRRDDGSIATPRFIAWIDAATRRLRGTIVLLDKATGVTQADVWASFDEMVDRERGWGLPMNLYLDNGSEYFGRPRRYGEGVPSAIMNGFNELTGLLLAMREFNDAIKAEFTAEFFDSDSSSSANELDATAPRRNGVTRATPYNGPGKPLIEGAFSSLEKVIKMFPGYIGGDRMNKRTPNLGKDTAPWMDIDVFVKAFTQALAYWNGKPQRGHLGGKSPNEAWEDAQREGWQATRVDKMTRVYAMSETVRVTVIRGSVTVGKQRYYADELSKLSGQKITVRYAKWAPEYLIYSPDFSKPLDMALLKRTTSYHPFDHEGAREAARMNGALRKHIKSLEAETDELDMGDVFARDNAAREPSPATEFGPAIGLGHHVDALTESAQRLGPPAPLEIVELLPGESIDQETGEVIHVLSRPNLPPVKRRKEETNPLASYQRQKKPGAGR